MPTMPSSEQPSGRRWRFTLRVLFIAVAVVALVVSWINTYRITQRIRLLEVENRRLRDDAGELSVEDPSLFHVMRIDTNTEFEWAWRMWIPEGHSYQIKSFAGEVPKEGFPRPGNTIRVSEPGEHVVRYRIRRDPRDNRMYGSTWAHDVVARIGEQPWVEWDGKIATTGGIGSGTSRVPVWQPGRRVELIRYRVSQAGSLNKMEDPAPGFLIWLEPN
jgi:hypothetical protein